MARNIEIKARIDDIDALAKAVLEIGCSGPEIIRQDDTFFGCSSGRLKLREFSDGTGELIFYRRADGDGPRESFYVRSPCSRANLLRGTLSMAYGAIGRVVKVRTLFMSGRTRIHLDEVDHLGSFLELEVVLNDDEPPEAGDREARELMTKLGIRPHQLIACAYVDLLTAGRSGDDGGGNGGEAHAD